MKLFYCTGCKTKQYSERIPRGCPRCGCYLIIPNKLRLDTLKRFPASPRLK